MSCESRECEAKSSECEAKSSGGEVIVENVSGKV